MGCDIHLYTMGCDIHLYTEVKIKGQWHCYSKCNVDRDYELFGVMAGVRCPVTPIVEPKGLPSDLSVVVKMEADDWEGDGHTHSWFNLDEIRQLEKYVNQEIVKRSKEYPKAPYDYPEKRWGYLCGNSYGGFEPGAPSYSKEIEDVRFVFWFDN